jgi:N-acetylglucosamine kinase-like BadF-type ATPase
MRYFLGIDTGSTKCHALIADETGQAVGFAQGPRGNPYNVEAFGSLLSDITARALQMAGLGSEQIAGAGLGVGGYDWPSQRPTMDASIAALKLTCPYEVVNDSMVALYGGASAGWGVAVVAGTSCNAWGADRQGRTGRMVGFSWLCENAGSSELVLKAVQAVALEWTRRGPATRLSQALPEYYKMASAEALLEELTMSRARVDARACPLVFQVAAEGDAVAQEIIRWAGRELGDQAKGIVRQLGFENEIFEVVLGGSFFNGSPVVAEELAKTVQALAPGARIVRLAAPPVVGGVMLGMLCAHAHTPAARLKLIETFASVSK